MDNEKPGYYKLKGDEYWGSNVFQQGIFGVSSVGIAGNAVLFAVLWGESPHYGILAFPINSVRGSLSPQPVQYLLG